MRNHLLAYRAHARRRPAIVAPSRSSPHQLITRRRQYHHHNHTQLNIIKAYMKNSIMLRNDIPEDQEFTAAAQQLTAKSLKILEIAKWNNYTVKLRCNSVMLCRYGVLINVFHCNRDVT